MRNLLFLLMITAVLCVGKGQDTPVLKPTTEAPSKLLQTPIKDGSAILWHLYHSGFVIKTSHHLLIFDYWPGAEGEPQQKKLANGFIDPAIFKDQNVIVFISHEHHDHFYPAALDWRNSIAKIHFIVSPEVVQKDSRYAKKTFVTVLAANKTATVQDLQIQTLLATDSGVAFVVKVDGLTIYHSGDHASWNWKNTPAVTTQFVSELLKPLAGEKIDIAMHTCDPRLKESDWGGFFAFAKQYQPKLLIPMHFKSNYAEIQKLPAKIAQEKITSTFWPILSRGGCIIWNGQ